MKARLCAFLIALTCAGPLWAGVRADAEIALAQAQTAVAAAERAGAASEAPQDFDTARNQLVGAQIEFDERDWSDAIRAAHRAHADARLAEARARQRKAEAATAQLQLAIETLRAEVRR